MIRVLIVDDQGITRRGLQTLLDLEPDLEVVGLASNGIDAISQVKAVNPDLVLMDVKMPLMGGREATRQIMQRCPHCTILMLTTFDHDRYIVDALQAGAKGYLLKDMDTDKLVQAIRLVHQGYPQMSPGVLEKLVGRMPLADESEDAEPDLTEFNKLTPREQEILEVMSQGLNNREIAAALFISDGTIRTHIRNMISRLNVGDRFQLMCYANAVFAHRRDTLRG
jgi:DNA-binding NarL/FixJ family response regulator